MSKRIRGACCGWWIVAASFLIPRRARRGARGPVFRRRAGGRLHHPREPGPGADAAARLRDPALHEPLARPDSRPPLPPLPQRLPQRQEHLHAGERRASAPRRDAQRGVGMDRRPASDDRRCGSHPGPDLHPARRNRPRGSHGGSRAPRLSSQARRDRRGGLRLRSAASQGLRPHRLPRRLRSRRPVVPEDRSLGERRAPTCHGAWLELPSVPRHE